MIRGVIFDLDGVILDSMAIWQDLGARYLLGLGLTPEENLNEILFSMSMEQGASYLADHYPLGKSPEQVGRDMQELLQKFYFEEVAAKAGAGQLLADLSGRDIPITAATSSPRDHVTKALERNGLLGFFKAIFTTGELGISKHQPDIYLQAAECMGTRPEETCVFEDSLYALKTAKGAGFYTVAVFDQNGETNQKGMMETGDLYIKGLADFRLPN